MWKFKLPEAHMEVKMFFQSKITGSIVLNVNDICLILSVMFSAFW